MDYCAKIEKQALCANKLIEDKTSLIDSINCNFLLAKNNYQLVVQLDNNKTLLHTEKTFKFIGGNACLKLLLKEMCYYLQKLIVN